MECKCPWLSFGSMIAVVACARHAGIVMSLSCMNHLHLHIRYSVNIAPVVQVLFHPLNFHIAISIHACTCHVSFHPLKPINMWQLLI